MATKDYIKNLPAAKELAATIEEWWHKRGFEDVFVWVESHQAISTFGTKLPTSYSIRSNIKFNIDNIENGMIE
jgi:hypothetical protein